MSKTPKRKPALHPAQMAFTFDTPTPDVSEGALSDLERKVASAVASILKRDGRSRFEVAGQVSALLDDDVTKYMLDAYSSESRDGHNISMARFLALVVATQGFDVLDALTRIIGCAVIVGDEMRLAEIGHLEAQQRDAARKLKLLKAIAKPLSRGGREQ